MKGSGESLKDGLLAGNASVDTVNRWHSFETETHFDILEKF